MKFLAKVLLLTLLVASPIFGQVPVTGNLKDITTGNITKNAQVDFELQNYGSQIPHIVGTTTLVTLKKTFKPDANGNISGSVYENQVITPVGTFYRVCIIIQGTILRCNNYLINGPFDLNLAIPLNITPVIGPNQIVTSCFPFLQLTPSSIWTITHNENDANVFVQTTTLAGKFVIPDDTDTLNPNVAVISWVTPSTGRALVCHGGSIQIANNQPNALVQNPTIPQATNNQPLNLGGRLSTGNLNDVLAVDGLQFTSCAAAITAAGSVHRVTIMIPSTYTGAECPTQTSIDGEQVSITTPNITIWDFRGGPVAHIGADWNGSGWDAANNIQTRLSITNYNTALGSAKTSSALLATNVLTGNTPNATLAGITGETWLTGAITTGTGVVLGGEFDSTINSTGGTLADVRGVYGTVQLRAGTTNITNAYGVFGGAPFQGGGTGTITNAYGLSCSQPTIGLTRNYCAFLAGGVLMPNNVNFDALDSGGTPRRFITFLSNDDIIIRPLADSNGFRFQNQAGSTDALYVVPSVGVGILTNPSYKFHVQGSTADDIVSKIRNTSATGYGLKVVPGADANYGLAVSNAADSQNNITLNGNGTAAFAGQITDSVSTGTAPFSITSTTPVANLTTVPTTYNVAGTQQIGVHIVEDSGALSSASPSTATITLVGSAVFTSNATYTCTASNKTTQANPLKITYADGSHFIVTGPNTVTDGFSFICVGN